MVTGDGLPRIWPRDLCIKIGVGNSSGWLQDINPCCSDAEQAPVPGEHGLWLDHHQDVPSLRHQPRQQDHEDVVTG